MGSVTAITNASADVVWKSEYQPFGTTAGVQGTYEFDGGYTGKDVDDATGLIYMWHRWQDPSSGAFISEDPAHDGTNWYGYANNNPLRFTDPTGLYTKAIALIARWIFTGKDPITSLVSDLQKIASSKDAGELLRNSFFAVTGLPDPSDRLGADQQENTEQVDAVAGAAPGSPTPDPDKKDKENTSVTKPDGIPEHWISKETDNGGTQWFDPENPKGNNVRVEKGKANSPNKAQQKPYVKQMKNGVPVDVMGDPIPDKKLPDGTILPGTKTEQAHIPADQFQFN